MCQQLSLANLWSRRPKFHFYPLLPVSVKLAAQWHKTETKISFSFRRRLYFANMQTAVNSRSSQTSFQGHRRKTKVQWTSPGDTQWTQNRAWLWLFTVDDEIITTYQQQPHYKGETDATTNRQLSHRHWDSFITNNQNNHDINAYLSHAIMAIGQSQNTQYWSANKCRVHGVFYLSWGGG